MRLQSAHIMGIGGSGMSAIARVMHEQGIRVTGCDMKEGPLIAPLRELGMTINIGHDASHIDLYGPEALIISSAIPADHAEIQAAAAKDIPIYKRANILNTLMADRVGIAVAGTHGKTTTTAMITHILTETGFDPTFVIGGVSANLGTNARAGRGNAFVIEADEYDGMFLGLDPRVAVLTTFEMDHPDMFATVADMRRLFEQFLERIPPTGVLIGNYDDPQAREMVLQRGKAGCRTITYGKTGGDWQALGLELGHGSTFVARHDDYDDLLVNLKVPGVHNAQNALAALAVAVVAGVNPVKAALALSSFAGVNRRFEVKGEARGVTVIDDYAHHPTAISATLRAAHHRYPDAGIWAIWEPHTFSRTSYLLGDFAASLSTADHVIITDVYRSRDTEDHGVSPETVIRRMTGHPDVRHIDSFAAIIDEVADRAQPGDVVVVMSAGEATRIADGLVEVLSSTE